VADADIGTITEAATAAASKCLLDFIECLLPNKDNTSLKFHDPNFISTQAASLPEHLQSEIAYVAYNLHLCA
jgi:hypothetical protein